MQNFETERLIIREFTEADAPFILRLLNEPTFIQYIADKGVRTLEQASEYLHQGPMKSYRIHGHGLCAVVLKASMECIGMCGLIKRDQFPEIDLGYAFLPEFGSKGYALESARAVLEFGERALGLRKTIALVAPDNARSIKLLEKLGYAFCREVRMDSEDPGTSLYERPTPGPEGPFLVRRAFAMDIPALANLGPATFRETFGGLLPGEAIEARMAVTYAPERLTADLEDPDQAWFLADSAEGILGFAALQKAAPPSCVKGPEPLEFGRLYVQRAWQGRGPGSALLEASLAEARCRGARTCWLLAWDQNLRALAFYRRHGFLEVGRHTLTFGGRDLEHLVMARALA
jgi:RimJ/RimL family protein N-acetyltransferase